MGSYDDAPVDSPYRRALARVAELERQVDELEAEIARLQWKLGEKGLI